MRVLPQDLGYAFRQLRKTPGYTITALLTLALGIGANSAIFTLVNAILLHDLPVVNPNALVRIGDKDDCCVNSGWNDAGDYSLFSTDTYYMFKKNLPEFEELAAMESGYAWRPLTVRRAGAQTVAKSVMGTFVSGNYFRVFGLSPAAGRLLSDADDQKGAPLTAVMSYDAWQQDFSGDPGVVGSGFYINAKPATVVGVAPKGFYGDRIDTNPPKYFVPMNSMDAIIGAPYFNEPDTQWAYIIGRVKPGTSVTAVQAKASTLLKQQFAPLKTFADPRAQKVLPRTHVVLTPGGGGIQNMQNGYKDQLKLLQWMAALVLLVACANIANLLLVRGVSRKAELSIRSALGAQRSRIVRQLLTESVLLSSIGGLLGLAVSYLGAHALLALAFPGQHNMPVNPAPSPLVIGFAFVLSLATGVLFLAGFFIYIRREERAGKEPLLSTGLFADRTCNLALATQNVQWLLLMGTSFVVSVYLQEVRGYSAIETGVIFTAATVGILLSSFGAERFAKRRTQKTLIVAGFVVTVVGIGLLIALVRETSGIWTFVPGLFLVGFGLGAMLTPSVNVVQSSFPEALQGEISGLSRSVSNLGSSFGTAIAGTILVSVIAPGNTAYAVAMGSLVVFGLIGLGAALRLPANVEHA